MNEPLQFRDAPEDQQNPLLTRMLSLRLATVNEGERSVEAVLSSDGAVEMWDWRSGEMIDEILLGDAVELPRQLPLLSVHNRWSLDDVLGSVRSIRTEKADAGSVIIGRLFFTEGDEDADRAWNKVRQGHLTDVSIGYRVLESTELAKGQTAKILGRDFTAKNRRMRVATKWRLHEASIVPIGADQAAKTRSQHVGVIPMNPQLRTYLQSIGLRAEATDVEAWQFLAGLSGEQAERAKQIMLEQRSEPPAPPAPAPTPAPPADGNRQEPGDQNRDLPAPDPSEAARQAVAAERDRVRQIIELAGSDVPDALRQQAVNEGWDVNRASREFLGAVRASRAAQPPQNVPYHATAHTGASGPATARGLAAGVLIGQGMDPVRLGARMHSGRALPMASDALTAQDCEQGHAFRRLSAVDLVRACVALDTGRMHWDIEEALRAASTSGGTLSYVFSTNVYAKLLEGWTTIGDTTVGWCDEEDVANFLQQEDIDIQASSRLERLGRGGEAKHASVSDTHETYKIARYAKQFVVDEQDIIDDRLGAIMRMPMEMGIAARDLRPDLVYSLLLENPTLVADSGAVFNATAVTTSGGHANLGTAALSSTALKAGITAMVSQRKGRTTAVPGQALNVRPRFLILPAALEWTGRELTAAAALAKLFADSSDPYYAQLNLLAQEGLRVVIDDRVGAIGVTDPRSGSARTGSDTNWYLTSGGTRGLRVAYRRGTGRQPQMRSFMLDKGQWGIGWDINMDIGAAFIDYRTWYKSTGAA